MRQFSSTLVNAKLQNQFYIYVAWTESVYDALWIAFRSKFWAGGGGQEEDQNSVHIVRCGGRGQVPCVCIYTYSEMVVIVTTLSNNLLFFKWTCQKWEACQHHCFQKTGKCFNIPGSAQFKILNFSVFLYKYPDLQSNFCAICHHRCLIWMWNLVSYSKGRTYMQDSDENIWI